MRHETDRIADILQFALDPGVSMMSRKWQAAEARHHFSEVVDSAVAGAPQFIRRRDGREVVVVSKEYYEKTKPNLVSYLLSSGYAGDEDDAFDLAMQNVRSSTAPMFVPKGLKD